MMRWRSSFNPGSDSSINIAGYCNKSIDAQMKLQETRIRSARDQLTRYSGLAGEKQFVSEALVSPSYIAFCVATSPGLVDGLAKRGSSTR